jgi:hypothetical protein
MSYPPSTWAIYNDNLVGTSATFGSAAGKTYSWWVHSRASNGAWSESVGTNVTCLYSAPVGDIQADTGSGFSDTPGPLAYNTGGTVRWQTISNASSCRIKYNDGGADVDTGWSVPVSGGTSPTGNLTAQRIYKLFCTSMSGVESDVDWVTVPVSPPPSSPSISSTAASSCQQITVNWNNVTGETGYNVYRNNIDQFSGATKLTGTPLAANTTTYVDNPSAGTYYYWVTATYVNGGETSPSSSSSANAPSCAANLSASDKDITAHGATTFSPGSCNGYQAPPASEVFQIGDTVRFRINLCNSNTYASASGLQIVDSLINLSRANTNYAANDPRAWNMSASSGLSISSLQANGSEPTQILTINLTGTVPQAPSSGTFGTRYVEFQAKVTPPANFTGNLGRFQNQAVINHNDGTSTNRTGLIYFLKNNEAPEIIESVPR